MEVKINKEIRNYTETIFFGLSLRQFIFSFLACAIAVVIYFSFKDKMNLEMLSWLCIIGAVPFAAMGFIKYNDMFMEEFIIVWLKSELLVPKKLTFVSNNIYYNALEEFINRSEKGVKNNDKIISKFKKIRKGNKQHT